MAVTFARDIGLMSEGFQVLPEQRLPLRRIQLPSGRSLTAGGRVDLLLTTRKVQTSPFALTGGTQRVVDIKTGSDKPLRGVKSLQSFQGLQIALYVLLLQNMGAGEIEAGIVANGEPWSAQMNSEDLRTKEAAEVLNRMALMQEQGMFGWTGVVRDPYSSKGRFPIATLPTVTGIMGKYEASHRL